MDAFADREKGFERKYQLDQEQEFRAGARRDKLFGQWIAGKLGLSGTDVETYAREVVASNFEKPGDDDMLDKVRKDLAARNVTVSDGDLKRVLLESQIEARRQIAGEKP
jgi:hypothetical protein